MKIHEYQGKELLKKFGVTVPRGIPAFSVDEAVAAAEKLGGPVWVVKAQIHAGGRGKGGGVKLGRSLDEVRQLSSEILGMQLRSEEHTSELQSLMRISYAVFCLKKKKVIPATIRDTNTQKIYTIQKDE